MSSLTDFQGALAVNTGSDFDTNVLTLTSADSTAIAGTHTVAVTSLAQTSSGYLAPVANASDPLTGSITIQAGSGAKLVIAVNSSDNTLSGAGGDDQFFGCGDHGERINGRIGIALEPGFRDLGGERESDNQRKLVDRHQAGGPGLHRNCGERLGIFERLAGGSR